MFHGGDNPLFAIAVPVGAWSPLLPAVFRSIALQTVSVQVALVDASDDPRVRSAANASGIDFAYRRHGPDAGQSSAIAEGWRHTDAPILAWLNADDVLMPGALAAASEAFRSDSELAVWFGQSSIIDAQGATVGVHDKVAAPGALLLRSNTISQPSCFVRRSAVNAVGGIDCSLHYTMDWDLWARLFRAGHKMRMTRDYLSAVLWARGTKTASLSPARLREIAQLVGRNYGPYTTAKTLFGFLQHHVMVDTKLGAALASRRSRRATRQTHLLGLAGYGRLAGVAALPVLNLSDLPQSHLLVEFSGADADRACATGSDSTASGPFAMLETGAVAPGEALTLTLSAPSESAVYFVRACWMG